ncbi:MAG: hypothetical protein ACYDEQ_12050 [Desulfocucumaceae bacterium]
MYIKKITFWRYCMRTVIIATPIGAFVGLMVFILGKSNLAFLFGGVFGVLAGIGISLANYKRFVAPMKRAMNQLEEIAHHSGTAMKGSMSSIADLEGTFVNIIKDLSKQLETAAEKLTGSVSELRTCTSQTSIGSRETAGAITQVSLIAIDISGRLE